MILDKIYDTLEKKYKSVLANKILDKPFEPITIRGALDKSYNIQSLDHFVKEIGKFEKSVDRPGLTIEWKFSQTIKQKVPAKILVTTEEDYIHLTKKKKEVERFFNLLNRIVAEIPILNELFASSPDLVNKYESSWTDLICVVKYLLSHDVKNLYLRQINVPVHTKFLEEHQSVIVKLLSFLEPDRFSIKTNKLTELLDLSDMPDMRMIKFLDKHLAEKYSGGVDIIAVNLNQWIHRDWNIEEVWIVENKTNVFMLPPRKNAVVIFGMGYGIETITNSQILQKAKLFYWGDLDEHGYLILSKVRSMYTHVVSVLMDVKTIKFHESKIREVAFKHKVYPKHLLAAEYDAFERLEEKNGRIEQEQLNQEYINTYLNSIV